MCLRLVLFTPNNIINAGPKGLASLNVIRQRYKGVEMMNTSIVKYGVLTIGSPSILYLLILVGIIMEKIEKMSIPETNVFSILFNKNQKVKNLSEFFDQEEIEEHLKTYIDDIVRKIKQTNIVEIIDSNSENQNTYFGLVLHSLKENGGNLCKDLLDEGFIQNSLRDCNALLMRRDTSTGNLISFAALYLLFETNDLYIDIVCSDGRYRGGGHDMIEKIKEISKLIGIKNIKLSSITEALGFYIKSEHFVCDDTCSLKYGVNVGGKKRKTKKMKYKKTKSKNRKSKKRVQFRKKTAKRKRRGMKAGTIEEDKEKEKEKDTCCMCREKIDKDKSLIPRECLVNGKYKAHKICPDCWWGKFAEEGTSHKCPGCVNKMPLNSDRYVDNGVIDLTEE
jgi:hypothetical protein